MEVGWTAKAHTFETTFVALDLLLTCNAERPHSLRATGPLHFQLRAETCADRNLGVCADI